MAQEVGAYFQRAGSAHRLHGNSASGVQDFAVRAEDQLLDRAIVRRDPVDRQIDVRRAALGDRVLHAPHALEQRHLAVVVVVHADAEVDLVRIRIGVKRFADAEYRVARRHLDGGQERGGEGSVHRDTGARSMREF